MMSEANQAMLDAVYAYGLAPSGLAAKCPGVARESIRKWMAGVRTKGLYLDEGLALAAGIGGRELCEVVGLDAAMAEENRAMKLELEELRARLALVAEAFDAPGAHHANTKGEG